MWGPPCHWEMLGICLSAMAYTRNKMSFQTLKNKQAIWKIVLLLQSVAFRDVLVACVLPCERCCTSQQALGERQGGLGLGAREERREASVRSGAALGKRKVRGEGSWKFLPDGLYFPVKLNSGFLSGVVFLFLFCCLLFLTVRCPGENSKDLECMISRHRTWTAEIRCMTIFVQLFFLNVTLLNAKYTFRSQNREPSSSSLSVLWLGSNFEIITVICLNYSVNSRELSFYIYCTRQPLYTLKKEPWI